jgi:hypothetical protein
MNRGQRGDLFKVMRLSAPGGDDRSGHHVGNPEKWLPGAGGMIDPQLRRQLSPRSEGIQEPQIPPVLPTFPSLQEDVSHTGGGQFTEQPFHALTTTAFRGLAGFPHFADVYLAVSSLVRDPEDVAALVVGAARDLATQNVRYVELTVTPVTHVRAGMPMAAVTEALDLAAHQVRPGCTACRTPGR